MSFLHNYMFNYNTVGNFFPIHSNSLICYGRRICVYQMDYYLSLPRPYFQALRMTLVKPPQIIRLQQFPGGKQLNFTYICNKRPKKTLWRKFPMRDYVVGVPQSGLWTKMLSISIT